MLQTALRALFSIALAVACIVAPAAHADDYTDIWWSGPGEDGWGVNLIQNQNYIFATFFVYGPAPSTTPIWYAATLSRDTDGNFSGGLYQTTGTGIGVPWNPADHPPPTQVGTATFAPTSTTTGRLNYNVNATVVSKSIQRYTLTTIALGASYYGTGVVFTSGCNNSAGNIMQVFDVDPVVTQTGSQLQIVLAFGTEFCTLLGQYNQEGQLFRIPDASYVCTNGNTTTLSTAAMVYQVKATAIGLEGSWTAPNVGGGCQENGSFAAVLP
jgi:hypothetical protein